MRRPTGARSAGRAGVDDGELLDELMRVAARLGVDVRVERFETPPARGGGRCVVDGRALVLLDVRAPVADRVEALAAALAAADLEDLYVPPEVRERIEAARPRRWRPGSGCRWRPCPRWASAGPRAAGRRGAGRGGRARRARVGGARRACRVRVLGGGSNLVDRRRGGRRRSSLRVALRGVTVRESGRRRRAHRRGGRAVGRRGPPRRRARLGRPRVPERDSRPGRRDAHPERRRLRPGGERHDHGGARCSTATSGPVVTLSPADVRLRLPRQRVPEPGARALRRPRGDLPAAPGRAAGGALRRAGAPPRRARA